MELNILKPQKVNAKTIRIYCKVSDNFTASILDDKDEVIAEQDDGYVWEIMPGNHYSDYLILDIDIDTGKVTNWEKPEVEDLEQLIKDLNKNSSES